MGVVDDLGELIQCEDFWCIFLGRIQTISVLLIAVVARIEIVAGILVQWEQLLRLRMEFLVVQLVLPRCQIFRVVQRIAKLVQLLRWDVQLRRHQFGL